MNQSQNQSEHNFLPPARKGTDDVFLSRYAECIFWMSRYLERVENIASLLDITQTFSPASRNEQNWQSVLALHCDEDAFNSRYLKLTAANVVRFYLIDDSHENSLISHLHLARINASQLRPVISIEMWVQLNRMYNALCELAERPIILEDLSHILSDIRTQCQAFSGNAESVLYRDQGWYFYTLGKHLERADQTTRLLDIKYHLLLPSADAIGSIIDASQWFSLLRAVSGYHAFRKEYPYLLTPAAVAGFLLLSPKFPRSVNACLSCTSYALKELSRYFNLAQTEDIITLTQAFLIELNKNSIETIISNGLHEYLDDVQLHIMRVSEAITHHFF